MEKDWKETEYKSSRYKESKQANEHKTVGTSHFKVTSPKL